MYYCNLARARPTDTRRIAFHSLPALQCGRTRAARPTMLYRLSTYHATPANLEAMRSAREDVAWPRLEAAGATPLGLWRVMLGGRPGDVIELVRFDSLVHWEAATD